MPVVMPYFIWYAALNTNWYFGSTMNTLLLPLPVVRVMTMPPLMFGPHAPQDAVGATTGVGSACAAALSKNSRWRFVVQPTRAIQLWLMRLVALTSTPQYFWW